MQRVVILKLNDRVAACMFATWCHPSYAWSCPLLGARLYRSGLDSSLSPCEDRSRDATKAGAANHACVVMNWARIWPLDHRTHGGLAPVS